jgi:hypothetical protein
MKKTLNVDEQFLAEEKLACGAGTDTEPIGARLPHGS